MLHASGVLGAGAVCVRLQLDVVVVWFVLCGPWSVWFWAGCGSYVLSATRRHSTRLHRARVVQVGAFFFRFVQFSSGGAKGGFRSPSRVESVACVVWVVERRFGGRFWEVLCFPAWMPPMDGHPVPPSALLPQVLDH